MAFGYSSNSDIDSHRTAMTSQGTGVGGLHCWEGRQGQGSRYVAYKGSKRGQVPGEMGRRVGVTVPRGTMGAGSTPRLPAGRPSLLCRNGGSPRECLKRHAGHCTHEEACGIDQEGKRDQGKAVGARAPSDERTALGKG